MATRNAGGAGAAERLVGAVADPQLQSPATSGVRPATRLPSDADGVLTSVLVEIQTGRVVEPLPEGLDAATIAGLAAALPEIFGAPAHVKSRVYGQIQPGALQLQDLVLISPRRVHVLQTLPNDPETALVSVANRDESIGWVISQARSRLERI